MLAATKVKMSGSEKNEQGHIRHFLYKTCNYDLRSFWQLRCVVQNNGKEMYKKGCYTCKVVFC